MSKSTISPVAVKNISDQIAKAPVTYTSYADIKSGLSAKANSMSNGSIASFDFRANYVSSTGELPSGYYTCILRKYDGYSYLADLISNTGLEYNLCYAGGTWSINSLSDQIITLNSNKANKIQSLVIDGTTDNDGDIPISLNPSQYAIITCSPDRNAPAGYYSNWFSVLPFGSVTGNVKYSAKCVKDNLDPIVQTSVRFTVYYIQL